MKAAKLIEPAHVIILGLMIAVGGVIWQMRTTAPPASGPIDLYSGNSMPSAAASMASVAAPTPTARVDKKPIYTVAEIEEMLSALRQIRELADQKVAPRYWAANEIIQKWPALLLKDGAESIITRLESLRDPTRDAYKETQQLLYSKQHYDAELRPIISALASACNWMDSALTDLIAQLKKYQAADKSLLADLVNDRFREWSDGINTKVGQALGQTGAQITAKTKELREWSNIGESRAAPQKKSQIDWNIEEHPENVNFLGLSLGPNGPQAHHFWTRGWNRTIEPISAPRSYIRAENTTAEFEGLFNPGGGKLLPANKIKAIPVGAMMDITVPFRSDRKPIPLSTFLSEFVPFTFFFTSPEISYRKTITKEMIEHRIRLFQDHVNAKAIKPPRIQIRDDKDDA